LKEQRKLLVFCPSGNFGNICGMVQKMGLPVLHFVASTNVNDTVRFLESGLYDPKPSKATISNAMDNQVISFEFRKCTRNDLSNSKRLLFFTFR
jgi:threonine synthase